VLQVWPDGTTYGGVSEAGVDRILAGHILEGTAVADLAYAPTGRKQVLRTAEQASGRERAAWPDRNDGE
jgi:hypothetical protein